MSRATAVVADAVRDGVVVVRRSAAGASTVHQIAQPPDRRGPDPESQAWLDALAGAGPRRDDALERLHALLVRAARFEIARRRRGRGDRGPVELDDLADQAAGDA